jgi:eukaryotic-like serine/threonine-protein kinase
VIEPGTVLADRYRVVRSLGVGGMGAVYLADDDVLERSVAIKRVHAAPESESGRQIMREARLGATLHDPALVTVYDVIDDGDAVLLVMEYVPGETLADVLQRGPMQPAHALQILRPVAEALDHAHAEGVVHRDVKPANVLLRDDGAVKLADLGVATSEDVTQITRTGSLVGTVAYMAPEQFEPGPVTAAADIYALAAVAFEMLAGRRAHQARTPLELMGQIREAPAPDLRDVRAAAPPAAAEALQRGLAREPTGRPYTATSLVAELEQAFAAPVAPRRPDRDPTGATEPAPAPPAARERRRRSVAPLLLGGLVLAAVVAGFVLLARDPEETPRVSGGGRGGGQGTTAATPPPSAARGAGATPSSAVRSLYTRAAEGDLDGAWALASPRLRQQFRTRERFDATLESLLSIQFVQLEEVARSGGTSTLRVRSVAEHGSRTDRCNGTMSAVRRREGWRLDRIQVDCASG